MPTLLWQPMDCVLVYSYVLNNFSAFISGAVNINSCSSYKQGPLESLVTFKTGESSKSKRFDDPCSRSSKSTLVDILGQFKKICKPSFCRLPHTTTPQPRLCVSAKIVHCNLWGALKNYQCPKPTASSTRHSGLMDILGDQDFKSSPDDSVMQSSWRTNLIVFQWCCWMVLVLDVVDGVAGWLNKPFDGKKGKRVSSTHLGS